MIKLGFDTVSIYPSAGITWENKGNILFEGIANIGNGSYISTGEQAELTIGSNFQATCNLKLVCYNEVKIGDNVLIGWDCILTDTDFHRLCTKRGYSKGFGRISIGSNTWLAMKTTCIKNSIIPEKCVVGANSFVNSDFSNEGNELLLSGSPAKVIRKGVYRVADCDRIHYEKIDNE